MNRDKFLQRISAANLKGSATAEEAAEVLMRAIANTCDASMPRRPSTYHRKPAYWWNEELAGLRNECNKCRRDFQRARKANRPNAIEEQEAYKKARSGADFLVDVGGSKVPGQWPYESVTPLAPREHSLMARSDPLDPSPLLSLSLLPCPL